MRVDDPVPVVHPNPNAIFIYPTWNECVKRIKTCRRQLITDDALLMFVTDVTSELL